MKRFMILFAAVCLLLVGCAAEPSAPTVYPTAGHLVASWEGDYPHNLCGVWSTDGKWENVTFGIKEDENSEAIKQWLLTQVEDRDTVTFAYQEYTYGELFAVMDELGYKRDLRKGITLLALYDMENCIVVGVNMKPLSPEAQALIVECTDKYGDMVRFEHCSGIEVYEDLIDSEHFTVYYAAPSSPVFPVWPAVLGAFLLLLAFGWVYMRKRRRPLPADGPLPLSHGQTEQLIREQTDAPSTRTDAAIRALSGRQ